MKTKGVFTMILMVVVGVFVYLGWMPAAATTALLCVYSMKYDL